MELLGQHFDIAFAAPDSISKFRELILMLAMRGKLVTQDLNDQPAIELLKEIEAEKRRLVKEGKIKALKPLPRITNQEMMYPLPKGWEWVRLGEIGIWKSGSTPSRTNSKYYGGNIPWVKSGEVKQGRITQTEETISELALNECSLSLNSKGSVLVAMYGANIGEVGILDIAATTNQAICACKTFTAFNERYLLNLIASLRPYFISQGAGAAQPNISREKIVVTPFPLPPLNEQHRIVAKIDELMACCDELEMLRTEKRKKLLAIHTAVIRQLLNIADPDQHRYAQTFLAEHFYEFYTVKENVAELRKAILQLAVLGKLVPQDEFKSGLSKIPLKDITKKIGSGSTPSGGKSTYQSTGIPLIRSMNVHFDGFKFDGLAFIDETQAQKLKNVVVEPDDVLLNITGASIGRVTTCPSEMAGARVNQHVCIIRPTDQLDPKYLQIFLASPLIQNWITENQVGATREALTKAMIEQIIIPLPSLSAQKMVVDKIDQLMELCDTLEKQNAATTEKQVELLDAVMAQL